MVSFHVDAVELRKIMVENGYNTITALEKDSGVSRNTISGVLSGSVRPSVSVMEKLAVTLKMAPEVCGSVFFVPDLRNA